MELKQGGIYIVKYNNNTDLVRKIKVIEITQTSIQLEYVDEGIKGRHDLQNFKKKWSVIEEIVQKPSIIYDEKWIKNRLFKDKLPYLNSKESFQELRDLINKIADEYMKVKNLKK